MSSIIYTSNLLISPVKLLYGRKVWLFFWLIFLISITACTGKTPITVTAEVAQAQNQTPAVPAPQVDAAVSPTASVTFSPDKVNMAPDLFAQSYPLSENGYIIPISLRHVMEKQAAFFFQLQHPSPGKLIYRRLGDSQSQREVSFSQDNTRQMITLSDLQPGEKYEARLLIGNQASGFSQPRFDGEPWPDIQFKTASLVEPLRIAVLGDASFGDEATIALVQMIASQNPDFVIHTGDIVYDADTSDVLKSYAYHFFKPFEPLLRKIPIYTVLGNHDYDASVSWQGAPYYDLVFPPFPSPDDDHSDGRRANQYYAFSYQEVQFLMLDTHVFAGGAGRAEQDAWLEQRLKDPRYRFTIPVFHVAPYSSSAVHPADGLPVRDSWSWRFEEGNVPLTLSGHFHHYERFIVNGVTYLVTGGGSSTLYAQGELVSGSQGYQRKTHYLFLEIYQNYIDLKAIDLNGNVIDQARIELQ